MAAIDRFHGGPLFTEGLCFQETYDMDEQQAKRMLRLAAFLRNKVPEKAFDFSRFLRIGSKEPLEALAAGGGCGTTACAVGWMPAVWPNKFEWGRTSGGDECAPFDVILKGEPSCGDLQVAIDWFGIDYGDAEVLFLPHDGDGGDASCDGDDCAECAMGIRLPDEATAKMVADHLEAFVLAKTGLKP